MIPEIQIAVKDAGCKIDQNRLTRTYGETSFGKFAIRI